MRIHELAKELNIESKDVLARAQAMGLSVTSASSSLTDGEAATLKDRILGGSAKRSKDGAASVGVGSAKPRVAKPETTIVRVKPKAQETEKKVEVHTTRKANVKLPVPPKPRAKQEESNVEGEHVKAEKPEGGIRADKVDGQGRADRAERHERPERGDRPARPAGTTAPPPAVPVAKAAPAPASGAKAAPAPSAAPPAPGVKGPIIIPKDDPKPPAEDSAQGPAGAGGARPQARPGAGTGPAAGMRQRPQQGVPAAPASQGAQAASGTGAPAAQGTAQPASAPRQAEGALPPHTGGEAAAQSAPPQGTPVQGEPAGGTETAPRADSTAPAKGSEAQGAGKPSAGQHDTAMADGAQPQAQAQGKPVDANKDGAAAGERAGGRDRDNQRGGEGKKPEKGGDSKKDGAKKGEQKKGEQKKEGEKDGAKPKKPETASKAKDRKGAKGKEQKGDGFGDKSKRHNIKDAKRRGPADDFRGPKRSPILEDSSLEKKPVKGVRRSRPQPKVDPIPAFNPEDLAPGTKIISVPITVAGFAEQTEKTTSETIMALMNLGLMMNINNNLDETTAMLLGEELGVPVFIAQDEGEIIEDGIDDFDDNPDDLEPRPPIITVMGHVDHGKTSLLDAIRETNVTEGEAGGITQHIGASEVHISGQRIVFLDTPGHEAFTAMRARGAHATDIAVLVVAADDGVMPQTLESISHAKAAGVPVIVAINKIDKDGANPDRVKQELSEHGILVEEWGGDTQSVVVSAKTRQGITELLEAILLQAEVLELKANPNRLALGTVIEARLDKARGSVATLLVLNGTLETGMSIVAGTTSGRIRAMTDYKGRNIEKAGPATAVEITGLSEVPQAGDEFNAVREDRTARDIAEGRKLRQRDEIMARTSGASLDTLFERMGSGETKDLNIIIKGDVQGSVGALTASLEKLSNDEVKINIVHRGVGTVNESDVMLAETSSAVIIGFNVRPGSSVTALAEQGGVEIRTYRVIYDAIGDIEAAMKGMLDPEFREVVIGKVEIRDTFKVPSVGTIGGAYVLEGKVQRSAEVRVVRDGIVVHEGKISSLKRFKDDVREVATGYECGIGIENYNDIKEGDIIEAFIMEEVARE